MKIIQSFWTGNKRSKILQPWMNQQYLSLYFLVVLFVPSMKEPV